MLDVAFAPRSFAGARHLASSFLPILTTVPTRHHCFSLMLDRTFRHISCRKLTGLLQALVNRRESKVPSRVGMLTLASTAMVQGRSVALLIGQILGYTSYTS
jgi:hypothetical protein